MLTREKFITNSSSSAFLCYGVTIDKEEFIRRMWSQGLIDDYVRERLLVDYGHQEHINKKSGKTITTDLNLENPDDFEEFIDNVASSEGMCELAEELCADQMVYSYESGMICPEKLYYSTEDSMEIDLSPELFADTNKRFLEFLIKLYPDGDAPIPRWEFGSYYS